MSKPETNDLSGNTADLAREQGIHMARGEEALSPLAAYSFFAYLVEKNLSILRRQAEASSGKAKLLFDREKGTSPFRADYLSLVNSAKSAASLVALATFTTRIRHEQTEGEKLVARPAASSTCRT